MKGLALLKTVGLFLLLTLVGYLIGYVFLDYLNENSNHIVTVYEIFSYTLFGDCIIALGLLFYYGLMNFYNSNKPEVSDTEFVSGTCEGEFCSVCGKPATNKLGEEIPYDHPHKNRHNLTAYVCRKHFKMIVG